MSARFTCLRCALAVPFLLAVPSSQGEPLPPKRPDPARNDVHGDPLPPFALARMGTLRFRPGNSHFCYDLSQDGKFLITGEASPPTIRFWEATTGKETRSIKLPGGWCVRAIAFSPDGRCFAGHVDNHYPISHPGFQSHTIYLGETETGRILHKLEGDFCSMAFSPDSKRLAARRGGGSWMPDAEGDLFIWSVATGRELHKFEKITDYAFAPDGKKIATGSQTGTVKLRDLAGGKVTRQFIAHRQSVCCLAFSADGKWLATGGGPRQESRRAIDVNDMAAPTSGSNPERKVAPDTTVRIWDLAAGKELHCLSGHLDGVRAVTFAPDQKTLLSQDEKGLCLWDPATGKQRLALELGENRWLPVVFAPDGKSLLRLDEQGRLHEWDARTGRQLARWPGVRTRTYSLRFTPDGKTLLAGGRPMWNAETRRSVSLSGHADHVRDLSFSPCGRTLASVDTSNNLRLWETASGKPLALFDGEEEVPVWRHGFSADGRRAIAVGANMRVLVCDLVAYKAVCSFSVGTITTLRYWEETTNYAEGSLSLTDRPTQCVVLSQDGGTLAVVREDHSIRLWDTATGQELSRLTGHGARVYQLAFVPGDKRLTRLRLRPTRRVCGHQ